MDVRITTRHVSVSDAFVKHATDQARKLGKYNPRLLAVDLIFEDDHGRFSTEIRADVPGLPPRVARAVDSSKRRALDEALRKSARQLRRERKKRIDHKAPSPGAAVGE